MGFLKTIVIIFVVFYVLRIIVRYILPTLFVNYMNRKMNEFSGGQPRKSAKPHKPEGAVTIDYSPEKQQPKKGKDAGEYVDYVDVKE
jgi:hypothetical protein